MNFNPLSGELLDELRSSLVQTMFRDTCLVYPSLSTGPSGAGSSDGRGGYGDGRGGQQTAFGPPSTVPCMEESSTSSSEGASQGVSQTVTNRVLYMPYDTQIKQNDEVDYQGSRWAVEDVISDTEDFSLEVPIRRVTG